MVIITFTIFLGEYLSTDHSLGNPHLFHPGPGPGNKGTQELASKVAKTCQA